MKALLFALLMSLGAGALAYTKSQSTFTNDSVLYLRCNYTHTQADNFDYVLFVDACSFATTPAPPPWQHSHEIVNPNTHGGPHSWTLQFQVSSCECIVWKWKAYLGIYPAGFPPPTPGFEAITATKKGPTWSGCQPCQ